MKLNRNFIFILVIMPLVLAGCMRDMQDQPRYEPMEKSDFFADGRSARPLVEGTIARGQLKQDDHLYTGRVNDEFATTYPFEVTKGVLLRGKERYEIYCSMCHGTTGYGDGMVVERGFPKPTSFHEKRLVDSPPGYFYFVMSNGFGRMESMSDLLNEKDRWAVTAYIEALQQSQNVSIKDLSSDEIKKLDKHNDKEKHEPKHH